VALAAPSVATVVDDATTNAPWSGNEAMGASAYDTATVTGTGGFTPTGTVTYSYFTNGTCAVGTASSTQTVTLSSGTVPKSNTTSSLGSGSYSFSASYSGDPNYKATAGPCEAFSITKDSTTTTVSESPTSVTYGNESTVVFSVTVTSKHGEAVPNGETVTVNVGTASCPVTLSAGKGTCKIAATALAVGSYTVSATYGGDTNLSGSTGTSATKLSVTKDSTTTTVSVSPGSVTYGNESVVVFTVTVQTHYGEPVPNGETVTVQIGSATCLVKLTSGKGTCEVAETALPVGSYSVSATYPGDADLNGSNASCGSKLTVTKDSTTTTVSVAPASVTNGNESVAVFTVTVKPHYGESVPTNETVTVQVGSATCTVKLTGGKGTCTIGKSALPVGSYSVSASYGGDSNLSGSNASCSTKLTVSKD
jgi:hypothetical protein